MLKGEKFDAFTLFDSLELKFQSLEHKFDSLEHRFYRLKNIYSNCLSY